MGKLETLDYAREVLRSGHFNADELVRRNFCINTLKDFQKAGAKAWDALAEIKEKKFYWPHVNVKEFCRVECGWTDKRFYQLVNASKVRAALPPKSQPKLRNERQARELSKVPEDKRAEVLDAAETFYSDNGEITTKSIEQAAARVIEPPTDSMGVVIPEPALSYWNRKGEPKELINEINAIKKKIRAISADDPMYANVGLQGVIGDLNSATSRLVAAIPAHVCPYCKGLKPEGCKECHGRGVMSDYVWKTAVPKTMKSEHPF